MCIGSELGSEEESGKDWSDLEREAAEEDSNFNKSDYPEANSKHKKSSGRDSHRDKHKSSSKSNHRFVDHIYID